MTLTPDPNEESNTMSASAPSRDTGTTALDDRAIALLEDILPAAQSLNQKLRSLMLLALISLSALAVFFVWHRGWSLGAVLPVAALGLLLFILPWRIAIALSSLKALPDALQEASDQAGETLKAVTQAQRAQSPRQGSGLFQLKALLSEVSDVVVQYASIGVLLNPMSLFFGGVCMVGLVLLVLTCCVILLFALLL